MQGWGYNDDTIGSLPGDLDGDGTADYTPWGPGVQRHGADLKPGDRYTLNIDLAQMGLGGDNSWGFWPLEKYRLPLQKYEYAFRLRPVTDDEDPATLARERVVAH